MGRRWASLWQPWGLGLLVEALGVFVTSLPPKLRGFRCKWVTNRPWGVTRSNSKEPTKRTGSIRTPDLRTLDWEPRMFEPGHRKVSSKGSRILWLWRGPVFYSQALLESMKEIKNN